MPNIIDVVLPVFIVIFIGYLIGKLTKLSIAPVVDINLYVGLPALVFVSLLNTEIVLLDAAKIWAAALIIMYGGLTIGWLVFKILKQKHSGLYVSIAIMNTVNIPFPIINELKAVVISLIFLGTFLIIAPTEKGASDIVP